MIGTREVDLSNSEIVHDIFPGEAGKYWVNFNWYWLELSRRHPRICSHLIEIAHSIIGFVAFGPHYSDRQLRSEVPGAFELYHMVIDQSKQSQGLGRSSTIYILQKMAQDESCENLLVACHPDNKAATALYKSLGFNEIGKNYDGDPLYCLKKKDVLRLVPTTGRIKHDGPREGAEKWRLESIQSLQEFDWVAWQDGIET